ncbi:Alcohol dehydrogenase 4 [Colletotrichum sp. SAR11_239]|nr:Alcohol dehydrogenase 4 [Colletotrichum sp. SAR11_239]
MASTTLPETMTAVQVVAYNAPYKLTSIPVPSALEPHDILVKVAVASYCHTDSLFHAGALPLPLPITASHEGAGTIVALGAAVANFTIGDRVMCGVPLGLCGSCAECTGPERYTHYCTNQKGILGMQVNGCMAEYVRADARTSPMEVKIPFLELIVRDITVRGTLTCSRGETETMLEHIAEHGIKLQNNIFHGLDKIFEALELVNSGKISGKAVIIVDEEQVKEDEKIGTKY